MKYMDTTTKVRHDFSHEGNEFYTNVVLPLEQEPEDTAEQKNRLVRI